MCGGQFVCALFCLVFEQIFIIDSEIFYGKIKFLIDKEKKWVKLRLKTFIVKMSIQICCRGNKFNPYFP